MPSVIQTFPYSWLTDPCSVYHLNAKNNSHVWVEERNGANSFGSFISCVFIMHLYTLNDGTDFSSARINVTWQSELFKIAWRNIVKNLVKLVFSTCCRSGTIFKTPVDNRFHVSSSPLCILCKRGKEKWSEASKTRKIWRALYKEAHNKQHSRLYSLCQQKRARRVNWK